MLQGRCSWPVGGDGQRNLRFALPFGLWSKGGSPFSNLALSGPKRATRPFLSSRYKD